MIRKTLSAMLFLMLVGCSSNETTEQNKPLSGDASAKTSSTLSEGKESLFTLKAIDGKEFHIDQIPGGLTFHELKEKVVIFVFFGHKCPPCLNEIPRLIELTNQQKSDLAVIGFEVQGLTAQELQTFGNNKGINYPLIAKDNHGEFLQYIIKHSGWTGSIPFIMAFDKTGTALVVHVGELRMEDLQKIYTELSK